MDSKELRGLMEAYSEVYAPEQLDELSNRTVSNALNARIAATGAASDRAYKHRNPQAMGAAEDAAAKEARMKGAVARRRARMNKEELDIFDEVLEFLQVEGYAETLEEAEWMMANMIDEEAIGIILGEAITSEKGKAKAAEMIAKRSTPSGRAKSGKGADVATIKHIGRSEREGLGGTPMTPTMARNPAKSRTSSGTGNKAARRAGLTPTREKPNAWKEEYVGEAQHARENPEKYEREQAKKSAPVRGERTPMPPRGDKRREEFEKWYAKQMGR